MFRVIVQDSEIDKNFSQDFENEFEAIEYAEGCNWLQMEFVVVQDEDGREVVRFENPPIH